MLLRRKLICYLFRFRLVMSIRVFHPGQTSCENAKCKALGDCTDNFGIFISEVLSADKGIAVKKPHYM